MDGQNLIRLDQLSHFKALLDNAILQTLTAYVKNSDMPTKISQFENDKSFQTASEVSQKISNSITTALASYALKSEVFSGNYADLIGKPTIPIVTNDLTDALKSNYDKAYAHSTSEHAPAGAQANVIESVKVNGSALSPTSKTVNINVPTNNNQLTNGAGYQNASQVQSLINSAINGITSISFEIVTTLPTNGKNGVFYLISNGGASGNSYDEYVWVSGKFEKIGTTDVDLSGYLKKIDVTYATDADIEALFS